jgi:DNA-binding NtrC family response regulator
MTGMQKSILLVDDEESLRLSLGYWLRRNNFRVTLCGLVEEARAALGRDVFDVVISDFRLTPLGEEGLALLEEAREMNPAARCILMTATPADQLPHAARSGPFSLYQKPVDILELLRLLREQHAPDPQLA